MSIEKIMNRDLFVKISFMYFLNHILKILEIGEKIVDIKPTEFITLGRKDKIKLFQSLLDFIAITKSGKIIIFEFKKNPIRKKDIKQTYNYLKRVYCKEKQDIDVIIITISKGGKITSYTNNSITFHPRIIKTKAINQQKNLKVIRNKFKNNIKLTSMECSLLIALPLFELEESEDEIVREMCEMIKHKRDCFPAEELDGVILGMYLNIVEYIDEYEQDKLLEMIDMAAAQKGIIATLKEESYREGHEEGREEGRVEGVEQERREMFSRLLSKHSLDEVAGFLEMSKEDIIKIID